MNEQETHLKIIADASMCEMLMRVTTNLPPSELGFSSLIATASADALMISQ